MFALFVGLDIRMSRGRFPRWTKLIQQFDFDIFHRARVEMRMRRHDDHIVLAVLMVSIVLVCKPKVFLIFNAECCFSSLLLPFVVIRLHDVTFFLSTTWKLQGEK